MSYHYDMDTISEAELREEIKRRLWLRSQGKCDYCERTPDTGACRFPERHKIMRGKHSRFEVKRPKESPL